FIIIKIKFLATDVTKIIRQHVARSGSECHMFCDMKNSAHTWLKEGEFFINFSKYYIFFCLQVHTIMIKYNPF
ncbi:MAG: hypothetical protein ACLSEL_09065, partial [Romboutsia timonensis]|uniref:hypothetical protein n=1 Tax=Romboutsia timonensis TaxID=1776391 RepID=UPI00399606CF